MTLEAPVGAGIETSGGERALDAKLVFLGLDVVRDGLQGVEIVNVIDAFDLGSVGSDVLGQQILVVDQAVAFHHIRDAGHLVAILQRHGLILELLVRFGVGHIRGVGLPCLIVDHAVDLEQGRRIGLGQLGFQRLRIRFRRGGLHFDLDAGLLRVLLGQRLPCVVGLRLVVQVVDLSFGVVGSRIGTAARRQSADGHRRDGHHTDCRFYCALHDRTFLSLIITLSACASSSIEPRPCNCRLQILCAQKQIFANAYIFLTPEEKTTSK